MALTPEELRQHRDAIDHLKQQGKDTAALENIHKVGEEQTARDSKPE